MIDPSWWPLASGIGMMAPQHNHRPPPLEDDGIDGKTLGDVLLNWIPIILTGIVVPVVGFLASEFRSVAADIATLKAHDEAITKRVDIHRADIDALRGRLDGHIVEDNRRFKSP